MGTYTGLDKRLKYLFENGGGGGGSSTLAGLTDVDLTSPTDGQVLKYDANNDEWINANESGGGGGTTVVANPNGTPTDWLNSLQVGNDIYSVAKVGDCYSTTERQIGCYTDGKPLYQKTFLYNSATGGNNIYYFNFANDVIIREQKNSFFAGNMLFIDNAVSQNNIDVINTNYERTVIDIASVLAPYLDGVAITVKYTKTTDTAGSGIWTPSGAYAKHYSTTEQVIGTWTDGSTIYEQSYEIPITTTIGAGINNILNKPNIVLIDYEGFIQGVSNGRIYPLPHSNGNATTCVAYNLNANGYVNLRVANDSWGTGYKINLTLRYIKTA